MSSQKTDLEPAIIVIFGISGDLARKYLLPALYHLFKQNLFDPHTEIVGISRRGISVDELLNEVELCVREVDNICDPATVKLMRQKMRMLQLDLTEGESYEKLHQELDAIEDKAGVCMDRLYYLSIPPHVYAPIVQQLGQHGLNESCQHGQAASRLLVEKPFGYDLKSAEQLIKDTAKQFKETQVFRIDHYLAKETAQNILTFRRHNPLFSSIWDKQHIARIDIVASEKIGVAGRAEFYESVGALRDFVQSHLLQLLALTTMHMPEGSLDDDNIHAARLALLQAIQPVPSDKVSELVMRAQYDGYKDGVGNPDSSIETFVSVLLHIDNEQWDTVPVRITTGKALAERRTEITLTLHDPTKAKDANLLTFRIQPNEGIGIGLSVKKPGFEHELDRAVMDFSYERTFSDRSQPDAYERVLVDAVKGDHSLFASGDEVLASWRILQPILDTWAKNADDLLTYPQGSAGPEL